MAHLPGFKFRLLALVLLVALTFQSACGTLLHPERRGQTSGRIDPSIAILNGIGLLFFLVPGLVAFAVDFSTGAIYLPPEEAAADGDEPYRVIYVDPDDLTPERISAVIEEHTGVAVSLDETNAYIQKLQGDDAIASAMSSPQRLQ